MKGYIYMIRSFQTEDVYYGSTTQQLCNRMAKHRCNYKQWLNGNFNNISSFEILKYEDAYIELVEEIEFQNKKELHAREGYYIRENNCVNKYIPCRTNKEYIEEHKEERKEYMKLYREANKDIIKEQQKQADRRYKDKLIEARRLKRESKKALP
jgi:hypothetical protein